MSLLASEVGLKQSSLYYYFPNRDAVVAALVAQANVVPLELIDGIIADGGSAAASVYRFVRWRRRGPVRAAVRPFNEIHRVATRDRERFAAYWRERGRLERRLASLLVKGIEVGEFVSSDARLTALTILSNDEGVQKLVPRRLHPPVHVRSEESLAALVVGGLLGDGRPGRRCRG